MTSRKSNTQKIASSGPRGPLPPKVERVRRRAYGRARAERIKALRHDHPLPTLVPCEVEGRAGYWRAIHSNGLIQTVQGTQAEALRKVQAVVDKMNAFEAWCRRRPKKQRIALL